MAKRNKNEKKVAVEYKRGYKTELYPDIAEIYEKRGKLTILGSAKDSSQPAKAKDSGDSAKG